LTRADGAGDLLLVEFRSMPSSTAFCISLDNNVKQGSHSDHAAVACRLALRPE
jgi:hypothetical protein